MIHLSEDERHGVWDELHLVVPAALVLVDGAVARRLEDESVRLVGEVSLGSRLAWAFSPTLI